MRFLIISLMCVFSIGLFAQDTEKDATSLLNALKDGKREEAIANLKEILNPSTMSETEDVIETIITSTLVPVNNCSEAKTAITELFKSYPVMFNIVIVKDSDRLSNAVKSDILKAIATNLFSKMESTCKGDEQARLLEDLKDYMWTVYKTSEKKPQILFNALSAMCTDHHCYRP